MLWVSVYSTLLQRLTIPDLISWGNAQPDSVSEQSPFKPDYLYLDILWGTWFSRNPGYAEAKAFSKTFPAFQSGVDHQRRFAHRGNHSAQGHGKYFVAGRFFQSVSARTAGFSTYSIGAFTNAGLFVLCILMFIGASPGSTGGGIKTVPSLC